ncbi:pilus assembly protein [Marinobacter halotolerans]|uniref:pilus assembly protein n=1 Tax=Marinobacter halotolerans TaxID=1569211 RepID=UPI001246C00F|nr:PilC/PilY family type IV pilus protein [Marinobacter halotolerans]
MISKRSFNFFAGLLLTLVSSGYTSAAPLNLANKPLFLGSTAPPLLMLTVGKNHKLYYEAYNDASDLNNDGELDVGYQPDIDYYGYFNSYACYDYDATENRFVPQSVKSQADKDLGTKTCNAGTGASAEYPGAWSGDFLNYVTMARIDALRKVFYGGRRSTDSASLTVLERTHIPQDAHTWAKEYQSYDVDGFYIDEYTPLAQPPGLGKRHLFGNVSYSVGGAPLLRVLPNTVFRPWEWASIERPVLGSECVAGIGGSRTNCEVSGGSNSWQIAEAELFSDLTLNYYDVSGPQPDSPDNASEFDALLASYEAPSRLIGSANRSLSTIQGGLDDSVDHYFSVVRGKLNVPQTGNYSFSVNGDDAVEFIIKNSSGGVKDRIGWYGPHGACSGDTCRETHSGVVALNQGTYDVEFRHHEAAGGDSFELYRKTETFDSSFTEYAVRVEVCKSAGLLEDNCKTYSDGTNTTYKPTGLLHDYGENESILFGLLTGSFENNLDGGVLRKVVSSFRDEVNSDDGTFTDVNGIVSTLSKLRTVNFQTSNHSYACGRKTSGPISNGECDMWGNPMAEMMYETVRYFSGKGAPTDDFKIADSGNNDAALGLPNASWDNPYDEEDGQPYCAAPYMMVVSDINVSYDSDKVPGSSFSSFAGDVTGLDVTSLSNTITSGEPSVPGLHYIGQSGTGASAVADNAPTAKTVESLATIRGLAPEEPTKLGSYYSAAIAYYGWLTDLFPNQGSDDNPTNINTFAVALASPLPRINIPLPGGESISLVPFAKSPGGSGISAAEGDFQPTNTIVDFYVEEITPTSGSFLINFEDVEQGADHDMDAIARYQYQLNADNTVTVKVDSLYAAGGIDQHMGYVISGTSKDGIYLVVHDRSGSVPTYYLDTPAGVNPGDPRGTDKLTLTSERTFTASGEAAATLLKDPLYFAAKWGGFVDKNENNIPDLDSEWDTKNNITQEVGPDGVPDNYFQVTNALGLKDQLSTAFNTILEREASSSTVTVNSGALNTDTLLFQAVFNAEDWSGNLFAYPVEGTGLGVPVWNFRDELGDQLSGATGFLNNREVVTYNRAQQKGVPFKWPTDPNAPTVNEISQAQVDALRGGLTVNADQYGEALLNFIRGDQSEEGAASTFNFRERETVLGDIVNSDPLFVPKPSFFYPDNWGASAPENNNAYSDFRNTFADRDPMLYFGANDGLFHAINAYRNNAVEANGPIRTDGGEEELAYMPSQVSGDLNQLADPNYTHRYYVDGPSTYGDVYFGSKWHTALVGALGKGGQGLFALDITDPKGISSIYPSFNESNAEDLVLWEFSDADDADMGYSYGDPVIVRMNNGRWAAIFANGYNNTDSDGNVSTTGNAVLFIVDIETGNVIRKLDTGEGLLDDPTGASRPNGLASPAVIDRDGDFIADAIYAGDLFGNMWKFDVSGSAAADWQVAHGTAAAPAPMFVAKDASGNELPITSRPTVGSHPDRSIAPNDVIVYFGTGKYLESNDNDPSGQNTQAFFAIWDDGSVVSGRSSLLQQQIIGEVSTSEFDIRLTTDEEIRWEAELEDPTDPTSATLPAHSGWYMDLVNTQGGNTDNKGERVVFEPILRNDRVIFTTLIPSLDECAAGGSGWLMEVSAISGARLENSAFDVNEDGVFNAEDLVEFGEEFLPGSGIRKGGGEDGGSGIPTPPAILDNLECPNGVCTEIKFSGTSKAEIDSITESTKPGSQGRQNWREVN